jgi:TolA-binding protein
MSPARARPLLQWALTVGLILATAATFAAEQKSKDAQTIKDLNGRRVDVKAGQPAPGGSDKAMENYRAFLDLESGDPALRAEALRRLGDLNLEAGEIERGEREQTDGLGLKAADAVKLYKMLLQAYPNYPGGDGVLYQLGRAYESNGQPDQALATLDQLVSRFPESRLIDEAQFRRGEILFVARRYPEAEQAYARVVGHGPNSAFYEQSLYKRGWALFKLGRNDECLDSFGQLLDRKLIDPKDRRALLDMQTFTRPQRELMDDTFRVASIAFSYLDGAQSVDEFVQRRGSPPYAYLLYAHLGDLYLDKERYQDAAQTYEAFVKRDAVDANAPLLQVRAIEAYRKGGFSSLVLTGKQNFVERYGFGAAFWNGRNPGQFPTVVAELKTHVKELASYYHAQAQQAQKEEKDKGEGGGGGAKAQADYNQAARWYRSYLTWFPNEPESADTNFLLAEALFESKQYGDATAEYERTAYAYPFHAHSAEAGYAALLAYDAHEKDLSAAEKTVWHAKGVESGLKFATTWPAHKEAAAVLTRTAKELFDLKDLERAVEVAQRVLNLQPPVDAGKRRTALTVIAHSRFDQARYAEAEAAYLQLRAAIPADDKERAAITEKLAAAVYKQAEQKKAAGDANGAVDDFLRVAQVAPDSSIRKNADYDAAAALVNLKDWPRAIQVLEDFRRNHPQDPLVAEATRSLAVAYTETQQPGRAAVEFERIADGANDTAEVKREALWRSAELYQKAKDPAAAQRSLEKFIERFPTPLDPAIEARQRLADMAGEAHDLKRRDRWLNDIVETDRKAAARSERSQYLAAKATLLFAEPAAQAFADVRLNAPLKKNLALKKQAMEKALAAYGSAAQYGVAEVTTAATFSMAELYRTFGKDLMESERPKKLKGEELEQYDVLLEEQAFPFEEKAIQIYEANAARARDGVYDEWVKKSFDALAKLKPARYAKAEVAAEFVREIR